MNEKEILNKCKEFYKECFNLDFNEKVRISSRMTSVDAKVTFRKELIDGKEHLSIVDLAFAKNVFQNPQYPQEELDKIIKHELTHLYIIDVLQKDIGHDSFFKSLCLSIGGDLGYANSKIFTKKEQYVVVCSDCGKTVAFRSNKPSDKLMLNQISSCCNADLFNMGKINLGNMSNDDIMSSYLSKYKTAARKS